jgi:hypothetical protein
MAAPASPRFQLSRDQLPSTLPDKIQGTINPKETRLSPYDSKINFNNSGSVNGNPTMIANANKLVSPASTTTKIKASIAPYHKKLIAVASGKSKYKLNKLGACAVDPNKNNIRIDAAKVASAKNNNDNKAGITALQCKNVNARKINFAGSCTNKFIDPLGANTVTKIYCTAEKLKASTKFI